MSVEEQCWRLGRRGRRWRPFCEAAQVRARGCSRRLQRALVDFGAEESFARATARVREHYGLEVAVQQVRRQSLRHGAAMNGLVVAPPPRPVARLLTEMDGSLIPVVRTQPGAVDERKAKELLWREVRLCLARDVDCVSARYGATLGTVEVAGLLWEQTARAAGLGAQTQVHGLGDGAGWIMSQFGEQFGEQGRYLVDFYHVAEYIAAAAVTVEARNPQGWRRRQLGRLLDQRVGSVLKALAAHLEPAGVTEAPVRTAHRYLSERREHLHYAQARAQGLPIGSGEIESGHRHVVQQRLKLAGAWWKETNAEKMLGLRIARANNQWDQYWLTRTATKN